LERLGAEIDSEELRAVPIHGDMALGNILVAGSRVVVLDFAMAKHGCRLLDLTRVFHQIELLHMKPQFRGSLIRDAQASLLEGFDGALNPRHALFRLYMLIHRINHVGSLTLNAAPFPASVYNRLVRRYHWRQINAELSMPAV
jgi:Ser/Thr protein kinase RdoA (MazF antagonist)